AASGVVAAVELALRGLQPEPVGLLVRRGPGERAAVERSLRGSWIEVGPLSLGAMHRLVKERLGVSFSRPVARRLWQTSGGNPFYGLELARELRSEYRGSALEGELPVPRDLRPLVARRVGVLPAETVTALCAASLLAEPTWGLVSAAIGRDASRVMQPAVRAEMVEPGGEHVRFTHPLYAAAVSAQLTGEEGRELHRRLAELVVDPAKRARHLAFAAAGPDETVALAIEHAAAGVQAQGAPAPAVELLERALQLTPLPEVAASRRRRLALATAYDKLGDRERARAILGELSSELPPGNERAAVLVRLGWANPDVGEAIDLYDQALDEADP